MDARKFFYVCAGLLCLAFAYNLGATRAAAGFVQTNPLGIRAVSGGGSSSALVLLMDSGEFIAVEGGGPFRHLTSAILPVPVADVLAFEGMSDASSSDLSQMSWIITNVGVVWRKVAGSGGWENLGTIPGVVGPVPVDGGSFGKTKNAYR